MLQQEVMIERVRRVCHEDGRLVAAMMYGSFAQGHGDGLSDIEFVLFHEHVLDDRDQEKWVSRVAPVGLYFTNEYGVGTAIFDNLVRGEFHFYHFSKMGEIVGPSMRDTDWLPSLDATLVLDRTGELARLLEGVVGPPPERDTPEEVRRVCNGFVNWFLFGSNVFARGELARALDLLGAVRYRLSQMVRVLEGSTVHWVDSSKSLETEISEAAHERYAACTARLDSEELRGAYLSAWGWGREMMAALARRHAAAPPAALLRRLDGRFADVFRGPGAP